MPDYGLDSNNDVPDMFSIWLQKRPLEREAVEFGVILGQYEGTVRVPKRAFHGILDGSSTPQRCLETFHLQCTRFETEASTPPAYR